MLPSRTGWRAVAVAACALLAVLPACASAPPPAPVPHGIGWATNGFDLQRTGENPHETRLGVSNVSHLAEVWHDAAYTYIDTSPVLVPDVKVGRYREDLLFFGTEEGWLYAVNAENGAVVWQRKFGMRIGLDPACKRSPFGITGTPAVDRGTRRIYFVDGDNDLYGLDLATGATEPGWPVALPGASNDREHVWSGVTLLGDDLYVTTASNCSDRPYVGHVAEIARAPRPRLDSVFTVEPPGRNGGGIWGWAGLSVSPSGRSIYVASGNYFGPDRPGELGDSVLELSRTLRLIGHNDPRIPPGDWDFGSTPMLYQVPGCPLELAVESKIGSLFVYDDADGISAGSHWERIAVARHHRADFIGETAYSATTRLLYVSDPSGARSGGITYRHSLLAFRTLPSCRLDPRPVWQGPDLGRPTHLPNPMTDPTVADGVVYFGTGEGKTVYGLDAATGKVLWHDHLSRANGIYAAPIVVNGWLYVPTWFGMYAFHA